MSWSQRAQLEPCSAGGALSCCRIGTSQQPGTIGCLLGHLGCFLNVLCCIPVTSASSRSHRLQASPSLNCFLFCSTDISGFVTVAFPCSVILGLSPLRGRAGSRRWGLPSSVADGRAQPVFYGLVPPWVFPQAQTCTDQTFSSVVSSHYLHMYKNCECDLSRHQ